MTHVVGTPWAGGPIRTAPRIAGVKVFSAKGIAGPGVLGTSPLPQIGTLIPGTPFVYVRPRLTQDDLGGSGGSVYVPYRFPGAPVPFAGVGGDATPSIIRTNPAYAYYRQNRRTPSIGMNAALSTGATMAVPYGDRGGEPHFSVA